MCTRSCTPALCPSWHSTCSATLWSSPAHLLCIDQGQKRAAAAWSWKLQKASPQQGAHPLCSCHGVHPLLLLSLSLRCTRRLMQPPRLMLMLHGHMLPCCACTRSAAASCMSQIKVITIPNTTTTITITTATIRRYSQAETANRRRFQLATTTGKPCLQATAIASAIAPGAADLGDVLFRPEQPQPLRRRGQGKNWSSCTAWEEKACARQKHGSLHGSALGLAAGKYTVLG